MGELPHHPAIIDRNTFQRVQEELGKYCGKYVLNELLVCGECGKPLPLGDLEPAVWKADRLAVYQPLGA